MSHWGLSDVSSWAEYGRFTGPVNRAANTRGPLSRGSATRALLRSTQQGICLAGDPLRAGHAEPETARAGDTGAVTGTCVAARAEDAAYGPGPWKRAKERERERSMWRPRGARREGRSAEGGKERGRERSMWRPRGARREGRSEDERIRRGANPEGGKDERIRRGARVVRDDLRRAQSKGGRERNEREGEGEREGA